MSTLHAVATPQPNYVCFAYSTSGHRYHKWQTEQDLWHARTTKRGPKKPGKGRELDLDSSLPLCHMVLQSSPKSRREVQHFHTFWSHGGKKGWDCFPFQAFTTHHMMLQIKLFHFYVFKFWITFSCCEVPWECLPKDGINVVFALYIQV